MTALTAYAVFVAGGIIGALAMLFFIRSAWRTAKADGRLKFDEPMEHPRKAKAGEP